MKEVRCADAGIACDFVAQAETEQELMRKVAAHAREKHGITEVPGFPLPHALHRQVATLSAED